MPKRMWSRCDQNFILIILRDMSSVSDIFLEPSVPVVPELVEEIAGFEHPVSGVVLPQ